MSSLHPRLLQIRRGCCWDICQVHHSRKSLPRAVLTGRLRKKLRSSNSFPKSNPLYSVPIALDRRKNEITHTNTIRPGPHHISGGAGRKENGNCEERRCSIAFARLKPERAGAAEKRRSHTRLQAGLRNL